MNSNLLFNNLFDYIESEYLDLNLVTKDYDIVVNPTTQVFSKLVIINYPIKYLYDPIELLKFNQVISRYYINDKIKYEPYSIESSSINILKDYNDLVLSEEVLTSNSITIDQLDHSIIGVGEYFNDSLTAIGYKITKNINNLNLN